MDDLLDYVYALVCRFIGDDPRFQNDIDDLVQDVFVRILPKLKEVSAKKQRSFAYLAAYSVCMNAKIGEKRKKEGKKREIFSIPVGEIVNNYGGMYFPEIDAEAFYDENKALIEWIDKETDTGVRKELRKQLDELIRELQ